MTNKKLIEKLQEDMEMRGFSHYTKDSYLRKTKEIQNILASSTKFNGPCSGFDSYENKTLTEELCSKYNLDCDRW